MNRRFVAAITAFILLSTVCFPIQTAYADDTDVEQEGISMLSGEEPGALNFGGDEGQSLTGPDTPNPGQPEAEAGFLQEAGADTQQEPEDMQQEPEDTQQEAPPLEVYRLHMDDTDLRLLTVGQDPETLQLPETAYAVYGRFDGVECEIQWHYDTIDPLTPGRQLLTGDILLPEGYVFGGEPLVASLPVLVYAPGGGPLVKIASCIVSNSNIIIPLGTDRAELPRFFTLFEDKAFLITEAQDMFFWPIELDLDRIDPSVLGTYYPFRLELPDALDLGNLAFYTLSVHVVPQDRVDLSAIGLDITGSYLIQWLYPAQDPILWVSVDDGDWHPVEEWPGAGMYNIYGRFVYSGSGVTGLELDPDNLSTGHFYQFQIQYDGQRFSNVLNLDLVNNTLPRTANDVGGDRNGGDREENPPLGGGGTFPPADSTENEPPKEEAPGNDVVPGNPEGSDNGGQTIPPPATEIPDNTSNPTPGPEKPSEGSTSSKPGETSGGSASLKPETTPEGSVSLKPEVTPESFASSKAGKTTEGSASSKTGKTTEGSVSLKPEMTPGGAASLKPEDTPAGNASGSKSEQPAGAVFTPAPNAASTGAVNTPTPPVQTTQTPAGRKQNPSPTAPSEYTDAHGVTLFGDRLSVMAQANPAYVSFLRDGLRVSVPTSYVTGLGLTAADTFTVTLYQPDGDSFVVGFAVNGIPLTEELPEAFSFCIPWSGDAVSCSIQGMDAINASLDKTAGTADFSLRFPGTYSLIREDIQSVPVIQQSTGTPSLPPSITGKEAEDTRAREPYSDSWIPAVLAGLTGLAAASAFLFWRKKGGKP
ncbi:MAG TPA: hypothetical protein GXX75_21695 [Clostridiales bacterium]|nr:hypothetical protein [Clostridiales bacterium]